MPERRDTARCALFPIRITASGEKPKPVNDRLAAPLPV